MSDFHLTLLSNADATNKIGDFKVKLPHRISLKGEYSVALTDIIFPYTFDILSNRRENEDSTENSVQVLMHSGEKINILITPGIYRDHSDLINCLNTEIQTTLSATVPDIVKDGVKIRLFYYKSSNRKCTYLASEYVKSVILSKKLSYMLGFDKTLDSYSVDAAYPVHTAADFLFVYINIVEYQLVSNIMSPLLKVINVQGDPGENVQISIARPQYVPVRISDFESVHIQIKNDLDELVDFHSGKICLVLHFRPL